jgi:hypothetical protein
VAIQKRQMTVRLLLIVVLTGTVFLGQTFAQEDVPKDYFNTSVQNGQRSTAMKFWGFLEQNQPDSALKLVDSSLLFIQPELKSQIMKACQTISPIYKQCLPRYNGVITFTDSANVISTYYTIKPTPQFAMWLSFRQGDKNSKIVLIKFKDKKELAEERKKQSKKDSDIPPPPPTPPPTKK